MVDSMHCLTDLLFSDIPLLYYYTNLNLSAICRLCFGDICLSFGISYSILTASKLFYVVVETFVILSAILLPIKSPVASAIF